MSGKRVAVALAAFAGSLALCVLLLLADLELVAYHLGTYRASFVATGAPEATGLSVDDLVLTITRVLDYSTGRRDDVQFDRAVLDGGPPGRPAFSEREILHLADVRALFALGRKVRWSALAVVLAGSAAAAVLDAAAGRSPWERRRVRRSVAWGAFFGVGIFGLGMGALAGAVFARFGLFWEALHGALFTNDLWLLPPDSLLIQMLPESLFRRLALEALAPLAVGWGILTLGLLAYLRPGGRRRS